MCHEYPSSSIQRHPFYDLILLRFTRLSAKQFEAREEQRELLLKETVEKARSFHRERSVVLQFDPRSFYPSLYPFRESVPRSALPPAISSRDREKGRGIAGKTTIRRTGVTGLWFVLTVYLHRARRSGLLARRARARACDFACREADHYETRFLVDSTFLQLRAPLQ